MQMAQCLHEFYSYATSLLADEGIIDDISEEGCFHHYNPNFGTKLDGWGWNELEGHCMESQCNSMRIRVKLSPLINLNLRRWQESSKLFNSIDNDNFRNSIGYDDPAKIR